MTDYFFLLNYQEQVDNNNNKKKKKNKKKNIHYNISKDFSPIPNANHIIQSHYNVSVEWTPYRITFLTNFYNGIGRKYFKVCTNKLSIHGFIVLSGMHVMLHCEKDFSNMLVHMIYGFNLIVILVKSQIF